MCGPTAENFRLNFTRSPESQYLAGCSRRRRRRRRTTRHIREIEITLSKCLRVSNARTELVYMLQSSSHTPTLYNTCDMLDIFINCDLFFFWFVSCVHHCFVLNESHELCICVASGNGKRPANIERNFSDKLCVRVYFLTYNMHAQTETGRDCQRERERQRDMYGF